MPTPPDIDMALMTSAPTYPASPIKGKRAEMEERAQFLIAYAEEHGPVTVRQLYYQAEVAKLPGVDKTDGGYDKIQYQVLNLRRAGIVDDQIGCMNRVRLLRDQIQELRSRKAGADA